MLAQPDAQIYLESLRGHFQTNGFRSFRTFNFEEYRAPGREAMGALEVFNDETLLPECSCEVSISLGCQIILLPLVGAIEVGEEGKKPGFVNSGEAMFLRALPDLRYRITNPYAAEAVNYLQIRIGDDHLLGSNPDDNASEPVLPVTTGFDLSRTNTLLPVNGYEGSLVHLWIGKYSGREDSRFKPGNAAHQLFAFIIDGAFEVQNRLLEKRDGLALSNASEIEFEALSNDAIILILEIGYD